MKKDLKLFILLILLLITDILTFPIWILTSFFGGIGIPGLITTIGLLVLHASAFKSVRSNKRIPDDNTRMQKFFGGALIVYLGFIVYFLSLSSDLSRQSFVPTMRNILLFTLPCIAVYLTTLHLCRQYNQKISN